MMNRFPRTTNNTTNNNNIDKQLGLLDILGLMANFIQIFTFIKASQGVSNSEISLQNEEIIKQNQRIDQKLDKQTIDILQNLKDEISQLRKDIDNLK